MLLGASSIGKMMVCLAKMVVTQWNWLAAAGITLMSCA